MEQQTKLLEAINEALLEVGNKLDKSIVLSQDALEVVQRAVKRTQRKFKGADETFSDEELVILENYYWDNLAKHSEDEKGLESWLWDLDYEDGREIIKRHNEPTAENLK